MKTKYAIFFLFALINCGCYENVDNSEDPILVVEPVEVIVTTEVTGFASNTNGEILGAYTLQANNQTFEINAENYTIKIDNALKKGQTIYLNDESGSAKAIATRLLIENDVNQVNFQTHEEFKTASIDNNDLPLVLREDITADFSDVEWNNGYTGKMEVEYIDIEQSIDMTVIAYTEISDVLAVESRGGFYLKATTNEGEQLIPTSDNGVRLIFDDFDGQNIGLFQFLPQNEVWVLVQNISENKEVKVDPTGYFTTGKYEPGVFVEGIIQKDGQPIAFQEMTWKHGSIVSSFNSTATGKWLALLPENKEVTIALKDACGSSYIAKTISVNDTDVSNEMLDVDNNSITYQTLDFHVLDCEGNTVQNPVFEISQSGISQLIPVFDPERPPLIPVCDNFNIAGVNEEGFTGPSILWNVNNSDDVDFLSNCADQTTYGYMRIREDEKPYNNLEVIIENGRTVIKTMDDSFRIKFNGQSTGDYEEDQVNISINDPNFGTRGYFISCENSTLGCGINDFEVTQFSEGGLVRISFSGNLWMQTLNPSVAGTWPVKGEFLASF